LLLLEVVLLVEGRSRTRMTAKDDGEEPIGS